MANYIFNLILKIIFHSYAASFNVDNLSPCILLINVTANLIHLFSAELGLGRKLNDKQYNIENFEFIYDSILFFYAFLLGTKFHFIFL